MALPPEVLAWIERRCGGRVVRVERQVRWRPHDFVTLEGADGPVTVVVRPDRQTVEGVATHMDIAHEARVLEALQGHGLKIPRFLGFDPERRIILMERAAGTNDFAQASDAAARQRLMCEYFEELARLHRLGPEVMARAGMEIPASAAAAAFGGMYGSLERDYLARREALRPDPLLELGLWWVRANPPPADRPLRLLQGDTGPGQFMFAEDRLTALIDWELAQAGDPMRDLAVVRIRNMIYPTGPLGAPLAAYQAAAGQAIDWPALRFYTVQLTLGFSLGGAAAVQRPTARVPDMLQRFGWDAAFRRGLCEALAEVLSLELDSSPPPAASADAGPLLGYLVEQLELNCLPAASAAAAQAPIEAALAIARTLQLEAQAGAAALDADLDDMAAVLGRRPRSRNQGLEQLKGLVEAGPQDRLAELVRLFARIERRREHLLRPMLVGQSSEPLERLSP